MFEAGRHNANNLDCLSVELDFSSHDIWVAAKTASPKKIAQDDHVISARLEFFRVEKTAAFRWYSEEWKKVGGCREAEQTLRCLSLFGEITRLKMVGGHLFKNGILLM